jgi:SAM-dependent methyltransferase
VHQFCLRGAQVTACDITQRAVEITGRRLEIYDFKAEVCVGNAEGLPFPDSTFDHVNCQGVIHHTPDTAACIREFARVLRPRGTACFSVYFRTLPLRSQSLFRVTTTLLAGLIQMRGRGRESMMQAATPAELVRMYDGSENPLGKSYTSGEVRALARPYFAILETTRIGFPRRVFPFDMPDRVHRILSRRLGLMIAFRCRKLG